MVTVISRFRVRNRMEAEVRQAFLDRPRRVEQAAGLYDFDVLTDAGDPSMFLLVTRWNNEGSFRVWHRSESHHASHLLIPKGLELDPAFTLVTVGRSIQTNAQCQTIRDAVAAHTDVISRYLADSETVLAVLLSKDGTILQLNCAAQRMFSNSGNGTAESKIWNHLPGSGLEVLRQRLSESESGSDPLFLLNLVHGEQSPTTWEARLLRCNGAFLLLATEEHYHDALFQSETLRLTNDLSIAVREATQKNRELKQANQTIEMLARTDGLTGLANRRMLEECLPKEVARAKRLNENLSIIFIDIDRFKPINDQFGHNCGDRILIELGAILKSQIRSYALAARFGGDEFVLLLPGTGNAGATLITERIAEKVRNLGIPGNRIPVTVGMGIATFVPGESGTELMSRADEALYRAKDKGRNRFEVA